MRFIGLDVHRDFCEVAIVEAGELRLAGRVRTEPAALAPFAQSLGGADEVALEVTGNALEIADHSAACAAGGARCFWRLTVPAAHELAVTRDGETAYVSRRTANRVCTLNLDIRDASTDALTLGSPDTLRLSRRDTQLTVGLRTTPAQVPWSTRRRSVTSSSHSDRPPRATRPPGTKDLT